MNLITHNHPGLRTKPGIYSPSSPRVGVAAAPALSTPHFVSVAGVPAVPVPSRGVLSDTGLKLVHGGRVFRERRSPWNEGEGGSRAFQEREKTTLPAKELRPAPQFCNVLVLLVLKRLLAIVLRQRPVSCSEFKGFQEQENRTARSLIYHGHLRIRLAERTSSWNCSLDCYVE